MLVLISLIMVIKSVVGDWYHETKAFEITGDNALSIIGQEKNIILDFFTPWCIYCQYMAGDWNQVWDYYNGPQGIRIDDILIAKINCGNEINQAICQYYEIRSFPAILHIKAGTNKADSSFRGNRHYTEFMKWIDQICPATSEQIIKTAEILSLKEELIQKQRKVEIQKVEEKQSDLQPQVENLDVKLPNNQLIDKPEMDSLNDKIISLTVQFESYVNVNQTIKQLEISLGSIEEKITKLNKQVNQVNWNNSVIFIMSGAFLGVLFSFVLMKYFSNKIENEEKSV